MIHVVPPLRPGARACCARCATPLRRGGRGSRQRTAALALASLVLYPLAMTLPIMRIERFGHQHDTSVLEGTATLLASGQALVGLVVLVCSILIPLLKLAALLVLSAGGAWLAHEHRALTYRLVEWTGRWGMLDVLLVALTVAVLKLGDLVAVRAGPGAVAFVACVTLSLLASASFDPHLLWPARRPRAGASHG
jgi:paraquat-inducible protein A